MFSQRFYFTPIFDCKLILRFFHHEVKCFVEAFHLNFPIFIKIYFATKTLGGEVFS